VAMEQSILKSTKKILGLDENYTAFDLDVLTHINSAFFTLNQLGVGPADGFVIEGDEEQWEAFTGGEVSKVAMHAVKSYVYLYVRLLFDPPGTPHHIKAAEDQKTELAHRLLMERELTRWLPPSSSPSLP
jgi:hypothetical protein